MLDTVTERWLSGRRGGVGGGESFLKALAIIRVAAEKKQKHFFSTCDIAFFLLGLFFFCPQDEIRRQLGFSVVLETSPN